MSRGHNLGSKRLKSCFKYSLDVITGTEPKSHNKTPLVSLCHDHRGGVAKIGFQQVKNEVKQQKVGIT